MDALIDRILAETRGGRVPMAREMETLERAWYGDQIPSRRNAEALFNMLQRAQRVEDDGREALRRQNRYDRRGDKNGREKVMAFLYTSPISPESRAPRQREILGQLGIGTNY